MFKHIAFRLIRYRLKAYLPSINKNFYKKVFTLTYRFFLFLKPSQLWIIILALINKTEFNKLISIPSMFMLFNSIFSDPSETNLDSNVLIAKLEANGFMKTGNNWENFFWILIILALIKRLLIRLFKFLWIPFKVALIFYTLKYFGFNFEYLFNVLNTLSLGVVEWFYSKITNFFEYFFPNDKSN